MIELKIKDIVQVTGGKLLSGEPETKIESFSIDSRAIGRDEFFIAIKGSNFDGHDFAQEAINKKASGILVEKTLDIFFPEESKPIILVKNTLQAMGKIASKIRSSVDIPVICITGTNGKTTVKDMLAHILSSKYKVISSKKSYNNIIGLSLTLFEMNPSHEIAVLELGTNYPGEISKLSEIALPHVAVITNIGDGHLESLDGREGIFLEKISLLEHLPDNGVAFLNKDDSFLARCAIHDISKKFYGMSLGSDFLISVLSRKEGGFNFSVNGEYYFIPVNGVHNVYNAAAAISVAEFFNVKPKDIRKKLESFELPKMRLEKMDIDNVIFINDCYNSNPNSFECALEVLENDDSRGKKGVVTGEMMELGEKAEEFHRQIGKSIANRGIDFIIALGEKAKGILEGAREAGMENEYTLFAENYKDAAMMIRRMAGPETVVLIKGSRKTKMEKVLKCFITSSTL